MNYLALTPARTNRDAEYLLEEKRIKSADSVRSILNGVGVCSSLLRITNSCLLITLFPQPKMKRVSFQPEKDILSPRSELWKTGAATEMSVWTLLNCGCAELPRCCTKCLTAFPHAFPPKPNRVSLQIFSEGNLKRVLPGCIPKQRLQQIYPRPSDCHSLFTAIWKRSLANGSTICKTPEHLCDLQYV